MARRRQRRRSPVDDVGRDARSSLGHQVRARRGRRGRASPRTSRRRSSPRSTGATGTRSACRCTSAVGAAQVDRGAGDPLASSLPASLLHAASTTPASPRWIAASISSDSASTSASSTARSAIVARTTGRRRGPCARTSATSSSKSRWTRLGLNCTWRSVASDSTISVHAPSSSPTRFATGTSTSSKRTSLKRSPSSDGIGEIVMPGDCRSTISSVSPRLWLSVVPVRHSTHR